MIQALGWVLDQSEARGSSRLVLIAIANRYGKNGEDSYPSLTTIAAEAKVDRATVVRCLKELEDLGELKVHSGNQNKSNRYSLPKFLEWWKPSRTTRPGPQIVENRTRPDLDAPSSQGGRTVRPESSVNRHFESSEKIERESEIDECDEPEKPSVTGHRGIEFQLERKLVGWMRDAAKQAGKHWKHDGKKDNRGPTWTMKDLLRKKENFVGAVNMRTWWIDFLLDDIGDDERFPYSEFMNAYFAKRVDILTDEQGAREMEKENRPEPTHAFLEDLDQQASKEPKLSDLD